MFRSLKIVDILYGIILIEIAAFAIITRMALSQFKAIGPTLLYAMCASGAVLVLIYSIIVSAITGVNFIGGSTIGSIVGSIIFIVLNKKYFDKRKSLFIY